jgi:hypothetical protein
MKRTVRIKMDKAVQMFGGMKDVEVVMATGVFRKIESDEERFKCFYRTQVGEYIREFPHEITVLELEEDIQTAEMSGHNCTTRETQCKVALTHDQYAVLLIKRHHLMEIEFSDSDNLVRDNRSRYRVLRNEPVRVS